uniref:Ig-like domain-containing protein n=1 Tax=Neogobius melanostomus TaxID=47308 RepID=A0A8C6SQT0_9GOBI
SLYLKTFHMFGKIVLFLWGILLFQFFTQLDGFLEVTLPCELESVKNIKDLVVEWARHDLKPRYVHIRRDGLDLLIDQNSLYLGRTRLSERGLAYGDMSLTLSRVRLSDAGTYHCFIPQMDTRAEVTLHVGESGHTVSVSPVSVSLTKDHSGSPELRCESRGWFPEPELVWLDSEGTVLTGARTEAQRGIQDDLKFVEDVIHKLSETKEFLMKLKEKTQEMINLTNSQIAVEKNRHFGPFDRMDKSKKEEQQVSSLELTVLRNPAFAGRATLFTDELKHGNISLKLTSVGVSDDGTYRCFVPELGIDSTVRLHGELLSRLHMVISNSLLSPLTVELRCQSEGWYPLPELQWLDSEGRALSADEGPLSDPPRPGPGGLSKSAAD